MLRFPWPRQRTERSADAPFFGALLFGCARSGTSILGELIASHPDVAYLFEASHLWEAAATNADGSHRLTAAHATDRPRIQLRREFHTLLDARNGGLLVEKCPRNALRVPFLREVFPEAKMIHIIRDGRDVACSLMPGIGGEKWSHLKPPGWRDIARQYQGVTRCAMAWRAVLEVAMEDLADVPHLQVRYEDLVREPVMTAKKILNFLALDEDPNVVAFASQIQDRTTDSYLAKGQDRWCRDDHSRRVGRWRENISPDEQAEVLRLIGPTLERLGYVVD